MTSDVEALTCDPLSSLDGEAFNQDIKNAPVRLVTEFSMREQRVVIFYILYIADAFDYQASIESVIDNVGKSFCLDIEPTSSVYKTAEAIINNREHLDDTIKPLLTNWRFERLGVCTRLILRYALWELEYTQTGPIIIINEAVELAKAFAEKDAYKFVNGILDEAVKKE